MKTLSVYDPALCCSSGVCGTEVNQNLVNFSADIDWLKKKGITVTRYNLAQQPMAFIDNTVVKNFLQNSGEDGLPMILLDGECVMAGRYPTRAELAHWYKLPLEITGIAPKGCCGSNTSCC